MLTKFECKSAQISALEMAHTAITDKIKMEQEYNYYHPHENEELFDWQEKSNKECEIRMAVFQDILDYIEKKI